MCQRFDSVCGGVEVWCGMVKAMLLKSRITRVLHTRPFLLLVLRRVAQFGLGLYAI